MRISVDLNVTRLVGFWKQWDYSVHRSFIVSLMESLKSMGFDTIMCPAWAAWPIYVNAAGIAGMEIIPMLPNVTCAGKPHVDPVNVRQKIALYTDMLPIAHVPAVWYGDDLGSLNTGDRSILDALDRLGFPAVYTPPVHRMSCNVAPPLSTEVVGQIHLWPKEGNGNALWDGLDAWERLRSYYPLHRCGVSLQTFGAVPEGATIASLRIAKAMGATTAYCFCAFSDQWDQCLFNYQKLISLTDPVVDESCWTHMAHEVREFCDAEKATG